MAIEAKQRSRSKHAVIGMLFSAFLCAVCVFPTHAEPSRDVEVTGIGESLMAAKENAIRQAVQLVVGTYVASDLLIENDQIIKDQVIGFSGAFVEKVELLRQEQGSDGLYQVHARIRVSTREVRQRLEEIHISTAKLDSNSLFGSAISQLDAVESATKLWQDLMNQYPGSAIVTGMLGEPHVATSHEDPQLLYVTVRYGFTLNPNFIEELLRLIQHTGGSAKSQKIWYCEGIFVQDQCYVFKNPAILKVAQSAIASRLIKKRRFLLTFKDSDQYSVAQFNIFAYGSGGFFIDSTDNGYRIGEHFDIYHPNGGAEHRELREKINATFSQKNDGKRDFESDAVILKISPSNISSGNGFYLDFRVKMTKEEILTAQTLEFQLLDY